MNSQPTPDIHYRLHEASRLTGYSIAALRKKILRRELGYRKVGRIISIPQHEISRLLGPYHAPILGQ
jgi:hypothetical protein